MNRYIFKKIRIINIFNKVIILLFVFCLLSCDDFLDKNAGDKITEEEVWKDKNLIESFVNNIYLGLPSGFNRSWALLSSATDESTNSYTWPQVKRFWTGEITPSNIPIFSWSNYYSYIRKANTFLENIDKVKQSVLAKELKDRMKGEAIFLRGFYYFELVNLWGGVPLIEKPQLLNDNNLLLPRDTKDKCIEFVISEMDKAITLLPLNYTGVNVGRATKGAAMGIKSRALLYNERWQEAAQESKKIMDLGKYSLFNNYEKLFHKQNDNNSEVIFDKQFKEPDITHYVHRISAPKSYSSGWGGTNPTQDLVDAYEMNDGKKAGGIKLLNNVTGEYKDVDPLQVSSKYDPSDIYKDRDPRFYATILYHGIDWAGKKTDFRDGQKDGIGGNNDATRTGYYLRKFVNEDHVKDPNIINKGENNWIIMRYAEVLLNYAEAQNEFAGPDASVYKAINDIRSRANMPAIPAGKTKDEMRLIIRQERRIELAFEEHRFYDVRRWGLGDKIFNSKINGVKLNKQGDNYTRFEVEARVFIKNKHELLPIPFNEINKNSKLKQNPGY